MVLSEVAFTGGCLLRTRRCVPERLSLVNSEIVGVCFKKQNKELCVCVCAHAHTRMHMQRSENNLSSCSSIASHLAS